MEERASKKQRTAPTTTEYLNSIYTSLLTTSNSINGLYRNTLNNNKYGLIITIEDVKEFLNTQTAYNVFQTFK